MRGTTFLQSTTTAQLQSRTTVDDDMPEKLDVLLVSVASENGLNITIRNTKARNSPLNSIPFRLRKRKSRRRRWHAHGCERRLELPLWLGHLFVRDAAQTISVTMRRANEFW